QRPVALRPGEHPIIREPAPFARQRGGCCRLEVLDRETLGIVVAEREIVPGPARPPHGWRRRARRHQRAEIERHCTFPLSRPRLASPHWPSRAIDANAPIGGIAQKPTSPRSP